MSSNDANHHPYKDHAASNDHFYAHHSKHDYNAYNDNDDTSYPKTRTVPNTKIYNFDDAMSTNHASNDDGGNDNVKLPTNISDHDLCMDNQRISIPTQISNLNIYEMN